MRVEEELARFSPPKDTIFTIGVFDGVHLGHKFLISKLVEQAHKQNLLSGVVTFRQHPRDLFSPRSKLLYLVSIAEREQLLKNEGVDIVVTLSFDKELANLSARDFISLLKKHLKIRGLIIGPDFALGKSREGNAETLRSLGEEMGFSVSVVTARKISGETASSTAIRQALAEGDMEKVTRLLGRPFSLQGKVTKGEHRGTGMGFPTVNLSIDAKRAIPPDGVYATRAYIGSQEFQAMTNIGKRPTFGENNERTIESYILNYNQDIYGKDVKIEIIQRLREEKRFDSIEELKQQIAEDVKRGAEILSMQGRK
ncbi:MAG: bifunctional riboflavin kinase/FAD synthetase [Dehalococcoidales bacterium]|nr:bifunctional riboflavin kinase/FAD synthetase [Dehalococcoidales bacterium]